MRFCICAFVLHPWHFTLPFFPLLSQSNHSEILSPSSQAILTHAALTSSALAFPSAWNCLLPDPHLATSLTRFSSLLKYHLIGKDFLQHPYQTNLSLLIRSPCSIFFLQHFPPPWCFPCLIVYYSSPPTRIKVCNVRSFDYFISCFIPIIWNSSWDRNHRKRMGGKVEIMFNLDDFPVAVGYSCGHALLTAGDIWVWS